MTNTEIHDFIENAIAENKVMLFMKGTPEQPRCGFSLRTSGALNALGVRYAAATTILCLLIGYPVGVADDPAAVHRRRAGGRVRHRDGDVRDG